MTTPRPQARTRARTLVGLVAVLAAVPAAVLSGSPAARADVLTTDASYSCQYSGAETVVETTVDGLPLLSGLPVPVPVPVLPSVGGGDDVGVQVRLDAPAQVAPGGVLRLSGTATFTFGPDATATNASTVFDFLSDSFGVEVSGGGGSDRFLRIAELDTDESTVGSPVVTARWTLPDLLVPTTATGRLGLALPSEPVATNPVSTDPAAVAFTGLLRTDSRVQPDRAVACSLPPGQDVTLGSVRVAGRAEEPVTDEETAPAPAPAGPGSPAAPGAAPAVDAPVTSAPPAPGSPAAPTAGTPASLPSDQVALAADPIPPTTVTDGVRLSPAALLLGGVFVAGGLVAAVSTSRRLRRTATAAGLVALVVVPTPLNPPVRADAATGQAQVTLLCVYEPEGSTSDAVPKSQPTGLSISLEVPDSVAPGEVVTVTGSASVQAPEDIRSQGAALGFNQLDAISDTFSVGATIGSSARQVLAADRWQTGRTAFSNPLVVRGPLSFPAFRVPEDATGAVALELPRNEVVDRRPPPNSNPDTPPRVAVEFLASASGNGTSITYVVSCWRSDRGDGRIATIPVRDASAPAPAAAPADAAGAPAPGAPAPTAAGGRSPVSPGGLPTAAPGAVPAAPGAAVPVPGAPQGTVAPALQGAGAPATAAPVAPASPDVVLPTWAVLLVVLLSLGGYGYAAWSHLQTRSARERART